MECSLRKNYLTIHKTKFTLDVTFSINDNEILVIMGESGGGKSTVLNLLSGIIPIDEGYIKNKTITYADTLHKIHMPVYQRRFAYIQQKSNLFPHLTALENIMYGCKEGNKDLLEHYCELFEIKNHLFKYSNELSGGQQQRIAIIRALLTKPDLLLFDEPFSALDNRLRDCLRQQIIYLKNSLKIPILFVTHDLDEAYQVADRILLIENGKIAEEGTKDQIFHRPSTVETARFVGIHNIIEGTTVRDGQVIKCYVGVRPYNLIYIKENRQITQDLNINLCNGTIMEKITHRDRCSLKVKILLLDENKTEIQPIHMVINGEKSMFYPNMGQQVLEMTLPYYTIDHYGLEKDSNIQVSIRPQDILLLDGQRG